MEGPSRPSESVHLKSNPPDDLAERIATRVAERLRDGYDDDRRLIDLPALADRLGLSPRGVTGLVARGELPQGFPIGGVRRWSWADVLKFLAGRQGRRMRRGRGRRVPRPPGTDQ